MKKSLFFVLTLLCSMQLFAQVRYITATGAGDLSGSSWANASKDVQDMINASASGNEIWIAAGVYKPNRLEHDFGTSVVPSRLVAFKLKDGVKLYGGFAGNETLLSQRNWATNKTIFSGDIDNNDVQAAGISSVVIGNNTVHVLIGAGVGTNTTVDGFFITAGYTLNGLNVTINGILMDSQLGSGIANRNASPVITNCTFIGNEGEGGGGGISNYNSSPAISNCTFSNNLVYLSGTGILNSTTSNPTITNCTFNNNLAGTLGGAIYNGASSPTVTNCTFTSNTSNSAGGAIFSTAVQSTPVITNCSFTGNSSYSGGAINLFGSASNTIKNCSFINNSSDNDGGAVYGSATAGIINIMNCLFYNNHANIASGFGGGIYSINTSNNNSVMGCTFYGNTASNGTAINSTNGNLKVYNSVVWGTSTGGSYDFKNSVAEGFAGGTNGNLNGTIITAAQLFTNAAAGNLTPSPVSPAIDAGSNALYTAAGGNLATDKDVANHARLVNSTIDIGGYEFDANILPLQFGVVAAAQEKDNAIISWQTFNAYNTSNFEIEFSTDGIHFEKIATIPSVNTSSYTYTYKHFLPAGTQLYYRIKQVDQNGASSYSPVAKLLMSKKTVLMVYPNPAAEILFVKNSTDGAAEWIQIVSNDGKILQQQKAVANLQLNIKNLTPGMYTLRIINRDKTSRTISFLKQ